jgi:hypothetical protein
LVILAKVLFAIVVSLQKMMKKVKKESETWKRDLEKIAAVLSVFLPTQNPKERALVGQFTEFNIVS